MARKRYQQGSVVLRKGARTAVWVGRWREDTIETNGTIRRVCRKEVLGTQHDLPTRKLALRELANRLAPINSTNYQPLRVATFADFAAIWQTNALTQHKPSTQAVVRSQLRKWLIPYFGDYSMRNIGGQQIQTFVQNCRRSPKTILNFTLTLRMMWNAAKAWGYVDSNPFTGLVLPKITHQSRFFFTVEEIQKIIATAEEPYKTLYWLAAESGMRAGELCGLRVEDLNLESRIVNVKQSVWRNRVQTPKTDNSIREFAISTQLATHLQQFLTTWRSNPLGLVFATERGKPLSPCNVMRGNFHPLLDSLGIRRCGLHAFRHSSASLMDRLNAPMKTRQQRLGHAAGSSITMLTYTHTVSADDRAVAVQLGDLLCPDVSKTTKRQIIEIVQSTTVQ